MIDGHRESLSSTSQFHQIQKRKIPVYTLGNQIPLPTAPSKLLFCWPLKGMDIKPKTLPGDTDPKSILFLTTESCFPLSTNLSALDLSRYGPIYQASSTCYASQLQYPKCLNPLGSWTTESLLWHQPLSLFFSSYKYGCCSVYFTSQTQNMHVHVVINCVRVHFKLTRVLSSGLGHLDDQKTCPCAYYMVS